MCSIDHIAVPNQWRVGSASRRVAETDDRRLSDHDAYVIDLDTAAHTAAGLSFSETSAS